MILSENTYALVKDLVEVRELPLLEGRGGMKQMKIYDLVGLKAVV